jgi:PAS domain-containing protein
MVAEQHPVEVIMARGLMSNMTTAAFLIDPAGTLIFYNEASAALLGIAFEEAGPMPADVWGTRFRPTSPDGEPLPLEQLPVVIALREGRPAHVPMRIEGADGVSRLLEVSAFPIVGRTGQTAALAIFWEVGS